MNARTSLFIVSGLTPIQARLLRVEALVEAAELELYQAEHEAAPDLRLLIVEERLRLAQVATFAHTNGWPAGNDASLSSTRAQLLKLGACLAATELPLRYARACVEAPGPDCRPAFANYCNRLEAGISRARQRVDDETWGAP